MKSRSYELLPSEKDIQIAKRVDTYVIKEIEVLSACCIVSIPLVTFHFEQKQTGLDSTRSWSPRNKESFIGRTETASRIFAPFETSFQPVM